MAGATERKPSVVESVHKIAELNRIGIIDNNTFRKIIEKGIVFRSKVVFDKEGQGVKMVAIPEDWNIGA